MHGPERDLPRRLFDAAVAAAARQVAHTIRAEAIAAFTATGSTAPRTARERPDRPILGLTSNGGGTARRRARASPSRATRSS